MQAAEEKINGELKLGRLNGPFSSPPYLRFKACPLALRAKPNGKFRLLHNLSYPYNENAVNTMIPEEEYQVRYATIQDATVILEKHPGAYMAKADIAEAFRIVPIH